MMNDQASRGLAHEQRGGTRQNSLQPKQSGTEFHPEARTSRFLQTAQKGNANPNRLWPPLNLATILGTTTAPFFAVSPSGSHDYQRLTTIWEPRSILHETSHPQIPLPLSWLLRFSGRPLRRDCR